MKISLISSTVRLGGLDCLFSSVVAQRDFDLADVEVILVDDWYWYEQRKYKLTQFAELFCDVKIIHLPPKARYSHYDDGTGWNTGLAVASGELVIFQVDYSYLYDRMFADHWAAYKNFLG